jgi:hypothetical protein
VLLVAYLETMASVYDYLSIVNSILLLVLAIVTGVLKKESLADWFKPAEKTHKAAKKASISTTKSIHILVEDLHNKLTPNSSPSSNGTPPRGPMTTFDV